VASLVLLAVLSVLLTPSISLCYEHESVLDSELTLAVFLDLEGRSQKATLVVVVSSLRVQKSLRLS